MNKNSSVIATLSLSILLTACGGGGGGGGGNGNEGQANSQVPSPVVAGELEGTWVSATDGNATGDTCGLTASGERGYRRTLTFNANRYSVKEESCLILSGNKGSYFQMGSGTGTFSTGAVTTESSDPTVRMRALDLISSETFYTSYNLVSNKLRIAGPFQTYDGTTREKRAFQIATYYDSASRTLIENPTYIKQ